MIDQEGDHFLLHHEEVLGERIGPGLWPHLWLKEAGLRNHVEFCVPSPPASRHRLSWGQLCRAGRVVANM